MFTIRTVFKELIVDELEENFLRSVEEFEDRDSKTKDLSPSAPSEALVVKRQQMQLVRAAGRAIKISLQQIKENGLNTAEFRSAAFIALEINLLEFIKNSIDSKATFFELSIFTGPGVKITLHDDGVKFPETFFNKHAKVNFFVDILKNGEKSQIQSEKNKFISLGGCGLGIAICTLFLEKHSGTVILNENSPKIELHSMLNTKGSNLQQSFNNIRESYKPESYTYTDEGTSVITAAPVGKVVTLDIESKKISKKPRERGKFNLGLKILIPKERKNPKLKIETKRLAKEILDSAQVDSRLGFFPQAPLTTAFLCSPKSTFPKQKDISAEESSTTTLPEKRAPFSLSLSP